MNHSVFRRRHWLRRRWVGGSIGALALLIVVLSAYAGLGASTFSQETPAAALAFDRATYSSPIALDANKNLLWVVNPDDDSVSVIGNLDGTPSVIKDRIGVGDEPQSIAIDTGGPNPNSYHVYVANAAGNNVTIITVENSSASSVTVASQKKTITTGSEPWNIVSSPDGKRVFVANAGQDTITVIDTTSLAVIGAVNLKESACNDPDRNRHFQPRGLAVTNNNSRLFVTRFLSFTGGATPKQGTDNGRVGVVCMLNINTASANIADYAPTPRIELAPQVTGFTFPNTVTETLAFPNQMQSVVIYGNQAYVPNIAASPTGRLRFNLDTHAFVNVIDNAETGVPADAGATKSINMHLGARIPESGKKKLFFANPWAIAFNNNGGTVNAYAVSAGSDLLVKLNVDATSGALSFTNGVSTTRYIDLNDPANNITSGDKAGKNPLGIVIRNNKAYVMNYVSRNVSIVDLTTDNVLSSIRTNSLPIAGSQDEQLHVGLEIFFSSRGHFDRPAGTTVSTEDRLSSEGWQNCASCHFAGLTDGIIWAFGAGPRKSVPLNSTWSPHNPDDQRILNYSAIFDEVQDFEANIRNVSGPGNLPAAQNGSLLNPNQGLIVSDTASVNFAPIAIPPLIPIANGGRPQHTVTLLGSTKAWPALDSMKEWVRFAVRTPNGMLTTSELTNGGGASTGGLSPADVNDGRKLFFKANCFQCHGGTKWTNSSKDFVSPPAASEVLTEAVAGVVGVQFLPRFLSDIGSFELGLAANPIAGNIGAEERNEAGLLGLGKDHDNNGKGSGFNIPSMLGIWHLPPYYHNGACETLLCVVGNVKHRTGNGKFTDVLSNPADQAKLVAWIQTLDADTPFPFDLRVRKHNIFIDPPTVRAGDTFTLGVNLALFGTRSDLIDLLGATGTIAVTFEVDKGGVLNPATVNVPVSAFTQDFGFAVVTTRLTAPNSGTIKATVTVDPANAIGENNENNNRNTRKFKVKSKSLQAADGAAPTGIDADITGPDKPTVAISDDASFNDNDNLVANRAVKIKIVGQDAAAEASGLADYCVVSYSYDVVERTWIEQECIFQPLPTANPANTYVVNAELQPRAGAAYAFVWLRDVAGNISVRPGFDVVTYLPATSIDLNRNDVTILRFFPGAQPINVNVDVEGGDVEVSVIDNFTQAVPTVCAVIPAQDNGDVSFALPTACPAATGPFQVEIRALVTSRFKVTVGGAVVAEAAGADPLATLAVDDALVGGPPPAISGIDEPADDGASGAVYLPIVLK